MTGLLRGVTQVDSKGCGVAAVATVTGRSYQHVRRVALVTLCWRASYGMSGGMMTRLLDRYKRPVQRITMGRRVTDTAIVKVSALVPDARQRGRMRLWQHWVVWRAGTVWDPGHGILWDGNGTIDGMRLYLASVKAPGVKVKSIKTGRWHWV